MNAILSSILKRVLRLSAEETSFARRGFRGGNTTARRHLEKIGPAFISGCHAALEDRGFEELVAKLNAESLELRGFAFEGAAMGLALLDRLMPWKPNQLGTFLRGPGEAHAYMVHVGVGWVWARLPVKIVKAKGRLDPLLCWLALDGYGFHEGFFRWPRYLAGQPVPAKLQGYERRAFDLGLGRSLWFVDGADISLIPQTIAGFPTDRRGDLWSGVGLACAYAGGLEDANALRLLRAAATEFQPELAQGAAFAAKARQRAGNLTAHTQLACEVFCGVSAEEASQITDAALENLPASVSEPAFEIWRCRIQGRFAQQKELKK